MPTTGPRVVLHILNAINLVMSLVIAAASLWFFCQIYEFTRLRNSNHYLLDYNVYWPQAVPWIFFFVALFVIGVTACGFAGARKKSRGLLSVYIVILSIVILCWIAAAIIALLLADNKSTDDFVKDTVWDVFDQAKSDNEVAESFGAIEKKLHCCGADSPRDYKNWKSEFPMSCCDMYHGWLEPYAIDCGFTNKSANERHGCSTVAAQYARIVIKVLSAVSIFIASISIISVILAVILLRAVTKRDRAPVQNEQNCVTVN
ncbi:unnamed protein product [Euphydryas editha]|uniref:Tetraspanin n=1 Tax=Euphydryas editha TaxID=104508 RepID=A0AAU9UNZ2_EUPED|nr:unnamed protein product [Euphydryas editha]